MGWESVPWWLLVRSVSALLDMVDVKLALALASELVLLVWGRR